MVDKNEMFVYNLVVSLVVNIIMDQHDTLKQRMHRDYFV